LFHLPVEYTGSIDEKGELDLPKQKIDEALATVFSNPDIRHKVFQAKTEMGFYRNAFRAIITMPPMKETPKGVDELSKLKFVAMSDGRRPATATMSQETRQKFGISYCCFRTSCNEDQGCTFREQRWKEIGYWREGRGPGTHQERKRRREAEQSAKREEALRVLRQLKAARRKEVMCPMYMEGKCDKKRYECPKGEHRSSIFSKTIACASCKEGSNWICRMGDECPYACHINPS